MKKVFAAGSFTVIHPGHIKFLEEARKLGSSLTVVVASDSAVRKKLGSIPVPAEDRRAVVAALSCVDEALIGNDGDIFAILRKVRPQVIALGYDQNVDIAALKKRLQAYAIQADIRRIPKLDGYSSTTIVKRLQRLPV